MLTYASRLNELYCAKLHVNRGGQGIYIVKDT